jgi:hypothetical protein
VPAVRRVVASDFRAVGMEGEKRRREGEKGGEGVRSCCDRRSLGKEDEM